ncbi:hypothetical protein GBW32_21140 [Streptomyces tsukubensis]|uniref:Proline-rich protein n=1 Tax=Streptomyces tsukubensis TaxID=83656 RepID=A0A1V3ZZ16_9ACTN|nr:SCO3374 family protein [Streptomyces tsukubensis]OON71669.1 hypothetical protein B1H18_33015 [Streptomyces tsukubensis]QFR97913.1 hypothetical protein GBW32_21140 [Streptomyces tsukubensis]
MDGPDACGARAPDGRRRWYERELGWTTVAGPPVGLPTGTRFDVLELPAEAGIAVLRGLPLTSPVALQGETVRLLVAAGGAEELPGLLDWLEWGTLALDLRAVGSGGLIEAPTPPGTRTAQGAALWLRPPEPGREVEPTLPALGWPTVGRTATPGTRTGGPDLVRLVSAAATHCHRVRLRRARTQPLAFS